MKNHYLILFFLASPYLFSQNQVRIDSLERKLSLEKNDSARAEILALIVGENLFYDLETAKSYNDKQFVLAQSTGNNYAYYRAHYSKAFYYFTVSRPDSAATSLKRALTYAGKSKNLKMTGEIHTRLGNVYNMMNKKDSALFHINKAIDVSKKSGDSIGYAIAHIDKGNHFFFEKKLDKALDNYLVSDSVLSKVNRKEIYTNLGIALTNISLIYIEIENFDKAENYGLRAKQIYEKAEYKQGSMSVERNLGMIDLYKKNYDAAEEKFLKVLDYYNSLKNTYREAEVLSLLGKVKMEQNEFEPAKNHYIKAIALKKAIPDTLGMLEPLQNLGKLSIKEKNYAESQKYYTEALELSRKIADLKTEVNCLGNLAETYMLTNNYKAASDYYRAYIPLKDSLVNSINREKVVELETRYQTSKKEQQIELLSAENQLGKQKSKNQFTIFASLTGLLLILGLALAFAYRNKFITARKIKEINQMKSRFFANISHEFRTPLTLIKSPLQNLQAEISDENQQKQLSLINKNSDRMLELVNQLLELSKIDSNKLTLLLKEGNIGLFLKSITEPFAYHAKENGLKFASEIQDTQKTYLYDKDVIEKIVTNLLSNAVKYTPENNEVNFSSKIENRVLKIKVSNSGTNLKNKDLSKLFDRFYQTDEQNQGFGIGLALIKELVDLYKGNIETEVNSGILSFSVSLPLAQSEPENIVIQKYTEKRDELLPIEQETNGEQPVLLIVDDNAEIRNVVKALFSEHYTILEATDGVSALELAQNEIPDCIVSDVMMHKMNGFEFTRNIKQNELTSFIPVLLLTAKTSDEARLESLKNEADAFLSKPFNNDILKETVHKLISERKKLQARYSRELVLKPFEVAVNSPDERFLEKVSEIVHDHLSDSGFSVEIFTDKAGLSRMQLHRKLKSLLGISARELIRNERLNHAAAMLLEGKHTVSEVGYAVGFDDLSYFSRSFKEKFNCTPTEFAGKQK